VDKLKNRYGIGKLASVGDLGFSHIFKRYVIRFA